MGVALKYIPHYTYQDWLHWEGRWELIAGIPVAMSPTPLPEHQRVLSELGTELTLALRRSGCRECKVYQPIDYKIADDTIVQPDLLIVCTRIIKSFLDFPPALVVEVLSKSTEEKDRGIKYDLYQQEGVKYYLVVDVRKKAIEVYELTSGKYQMQVFESGFEFQLEENCSMSVDFRNIWD